MDTKLFKDRKAKFEAGCKGMDIMPEILLARGVVGGRNVLMMLSGPRLTLESLQQLRADLKEVLDAKEKQLQGNVGPDTAVFHW